VEDILDAVASIVEALKPLTAPSRDRALRAAAILLDDPEPAPSRKPIPVLVQRVKPAIPKASGTRRSGQSSKGAKRRERGTCPDHRDQILRLLSKGPMRAADLMGKLGIQPTVGDNPTNNWEWRVNIVKLQQDGKVKCERNGSHVTWSLT